MRLYKLYSLYFLFILLGVLLFHFIIWKIYTKHVFPTTYNVGDLGRMSYKLDSLQPRQHVVTLEKKHFTFKKWDGKPVDILTIGDSFSNGGGAGENSYYQDYLATKYNLNILNIQNIKPANNYLETIYLLNNSKVLDIIKPKIIIFESTESQVLNRFSIQINKSLAPSKNDVLKSLGKTEYKSVKPKINFLNNLNYNAFMYNITYNFDDNAYKSSCYITKLNKELFSSIDSSSLLYYHHTIKYNKSITVEKVKYLNFNLNELAIILKKRGIKLYFMPAVDKHNLYEKYIIDNKYGKSIFFEQLRLLEKKYLLIDTKKILENEVTLGVKDIFYADDTHWSYKASEAISNSLSEFKNLR